MIRIIHEEGQFRPMFYCDHCNQPIIGVGGPEHLLVGNYLFLRDRLDETGQVSLPDDNQVFVVHKHCTTPFELSTGHRKGDYSAGELDVLPIYLLANLNVKIEDALEHARDLAMLG